MAAAILVNTIKGVLDKKSRRVKTEWGQEGSTISQTDLKDKINSSCEFLDQVQIQDLLFVLVYTEC
jgi:hypothetical protein